MAFSIQRVTSDGTLSTIDLTISYIDRVDISLLVDDIPIDYTGGVTTYTWEWVTDTQLKITPTVADTLVVTVKRLSDNTNMFHNFNAGAVFKDESVDENFLQLLYLTQEAKEGSGATDLYTDLNMHGYVIHNHGPALLDDDLITYGQVLNDSAGALYNRLAAESARDISVASGSTAVTKAAEALVSEQAAFGSAGAAAISASDADANRILAEAAAVSAAGSLDEFTDIYLGPKAVDPTLDNDGAALLEGALYWNNTVKEMRIYNGVAWVAAYLPVGAYVTEDDLADSSNPEKGAGMVGWQRAPLTDRISTVHEMLDAQTVNVWEFAHLITDKLDENDPSTWDWTPAIQGAMDSLSQYLDSDGKDSQLIGTGGVVFIPKGFYKVSKLYWRSYVSIEGECHSNTFISPNSTSSGFIFDSTNVIDRPKGINVKNLSISPLTNVGSSLATKPIVSAFNIEGFEKQCSFEKVKVYNLDGVGLKTGDTQDMLFLDCEFRFLIKAFEITSKEVGAAGPHNRTNAIKFIACRFENNGQSTMDGFRSTHFIGCKFEMSTISITNPHGLDFTACDWALSSEYSLSVTGTDRGMRILGGSTDTGLPIGVVSNTAKFITSTISVSLKGVSFRGHGPGALYGELQVEGCHFADCDRPYYGPAGKSGRFDNNTDSYPTNSTSLLSPIERSATASYEVADSVLTKTPNYNTWYRNNTLSVIQVFVAMPYDTTSSASTFQLKLKHQEGTEYLIGEFKHPALGGVGVDTLSVLLLPGEYIWYNRTGGTSNAIFRAFYR